MDKLGAMRVYVSVVEERGFTAASRALRMPLPTVCRKIAELENHLEAQLLLRSTRKVSPTETGIRYYEDVRRIIEEIDGAERSASGEFEYAKGLLTITAPSLFGRLHVLPVIHEFMQLHEGIEARLFFTNQVLDLPEEHVDVAFRIGELPESSATAIKIGTLRQVTCASREYIATHGKPTSPSELSSHQCITFSRQGGPIPWQYRQPSGKLQTINVKSRLLLDSVETAVESTLQNFGISRLYSYQAAQHVADERLEILLEEFEIEPVPISIVFPHSIRKPRKVRAFVDFAVPAFKATLLAIDKACESKASRRKKSGVAG